MNPSAKYSPQSIRVGRRQHNTISCDCCPVDWWVAGLWPETITEEIEYVIGRLWLTITFYFVVAWLDQILRLLSINRIRMGFYEGNKKTTFWRCCRQSILADGFQMSQMSGKCRIWKGIRSRCRSRVGVQSTFGCVVQSRRLGRRRCILITITLQDNLSSSLPWQRHWLNCIKYFCWLTETWEIFA